jgi:chromosome segregation ATPase
MGDAGEGLIDADTRIQERRDEIEQAKKDSRERDTRNPAVVQQLESLRLARAELRRQLETTAHERRRAMLAEAVAEIDRRMAEVEAQLKNGGAGQS